MFCFNADDPGGTGARPRQAVLRVVYSYLMDLSRESAPKRDIPLHTVMKITYGGVMSRPVEERFYLGPDVVAAATPY